MKVRFKKWDVILYIKKILIYIQLEAAQAVPVTYKNYVMKERMLFFHLLLNG